MPTSPKISPAQITLLSRVMTAPDERYGVQMMQRATAAALLRKGLVVLDTRPGEFCQFIKPSDSANTLFRSTRED